MPPPLAQLAPIAGIFPLCPARLVRPVGICPLPSRDRPPLRVYSHSPRAIRPPCGDMPFALTRLATLWCSHAGGVRPPHPAGAAARRGRRQGALSARAARLHGIFPLPSYDWSPLRVYSRSPPTIGPRCGYIPAPLPQLVPVADVFPLTSRNWSPLRMYSRSPPAIGPRCGSLVGYCPPNRSNRPNRPRMSAPAKGESGGRCVDRVTTLAKGNFLKYFKWDGGEEYNGRPWSPELLPSDAALLVYLFSAFMKAPGHAALLAYLFSAFMTAP
eukprot:1188316-Prorocentrum_minimum.AAC.1